MPLIRLLPAEPRIPFLAVRYWFLAIAMILMTGSIATFFVQGLNFGVDFRGGILMEVRTDAPADLEDMRSRLGALDIGPVTLQEFGEPTDVLINLQRQDGTEDAQMDAINAVRAELGDEVAEYRRTEFVGPRVGEELRRAGMMATLLSLLGIGLYIWFRFEWHFAMASLLALVHDVIVTIGFFSFTQIEFNLTTLAAVLTIAGYSINDTVVVFDRVRETMRKYKKKSMPEMLNEALNQTLTRTIMTSVTTLIALGTLYFFGGEVIRGFTAGLIWGVIIGTFSTVGIAVPLLYYLGLKRATMQPSEEGGKEQAGNQTVG
ncbi:protein translocase subunit SecF [Aquibaculum sediminis]|uniref:protein translocase subunit SecF n=1 Tax=Aquibaculum sediminis TaxID=3231907 RepID=UPI003455015B